MDAWEELRRSGKWDLNNTTAAYLWWAHDCFSDGDIELGKRYLLSLCKMVSNYEESIEINGLTELWEMYKHHVEGLLPPSVVVNGQTASEPTMSISAILNGPDDDLLTDLSTHLNELSANGAYLNSLNKWERNVWYADELCMEVNSGGFEGYLYYHGTHFEKAYKAITDMDAPNVTALLDAVRAKFPRTRIPKSDDAIQNAMDKLEDKGVDFEDQDDAYYTSAERELLDRMTAYVRANSKHFR